MLHSTHYNLNLAEGTDLVNPLTVDVPNYQAIDTTMFANEQAGVGSATELKSGTIHAITRTNTNRNVFRFKSTSVFLDGDTFTVDGGAVTALYPDGSSLKDRCFIIGSDVLCLLDGAQLTVLASYYPDATKVEYSTGVSVKSKIDSLELEIGNVLNWTYVGSQTGGTDISLPENFKEITIFAHETNDYSISFTWHIINEELGTTKRAFRQGYYLNATNNGSIIASVSKTLATISSYAIGGNSYVERITFEVYAR